MKTETIDTSPAGAVFYDADCPVCVGTVRRWGDIFRPRGFEFVPLQSQRARQTLGLAEGELPAEMKLLRNDGSVAGGPDAIAWMCRHVWWLWPAGLLMRAPLLRDVTDAAYRWVARNRYCLGDVCRVPDRIRTRHHAATTFLESP
jgi:predicted DCC family thiol-disulfide oxidoreductase YuxK